jgi:predicted TPR repeat methyltransferase
MRTFRCVLGIGTAAIVLAACGSSGPSSSTLSLSAARAKYSAALAPVTSALNAFDSKAIAWTASTTDTQAVADAHSAIAALQTFTTTLTNDKWPSVASSDVHSVIGALGTMTTHLQSLSSLNMSHESTWFNTTFAQDSTKVATANVLVYHDLGITPTGP